jgi:16S rRNA (cytidine1402-2'-O)-methyltransferase
MINFPESIERRRIAAMLLHPKAPPVDDHPATLARVYCRLGLWHFRSQRIRKMRRRQRVAQFGRAEQELIAMQRRGSVRSARPLRAAGERSFTALGARAIAEPIEPGLHIVATPIGNLGDVTLRALATLAAADAILAEDTRVSSRLTSRYEIATPLIAYHEHNAAQSRPEILERLSRGEALALISDAGTPLISDPGYKLVSEALAAGFTVRSLPGPSAALTALTLAGLPTDRFFFEGFLPQKSAARRERANALARIPATLIFYEAPGRLAESLADLATELGPRPAAVARELTKLFEETRRGDLAQLAAEYATAEPPKGEIVIVVGPPLLVPVLEDDALDREILEALGASSVKDAAAMVAARTGLPRREIYARALQLAGGRRR